MIEGVSLDERRGVNLSEHPSPVAAYPGSV